MEEIKRILDNFNGEVYNLCFDILKNYGEDAKIFEFVCKNYDSRSNMGTYSVKEYFSETEIEKYESAYGDAVDGLLNSNIKKCNMGLISPEDFYKSLWGLYGVVFSTLKEKAFAFYYTLIDTSIPYQYLGKPISMSNKLYQEFIEKNKLSIDKVRYIQESNYTQHTERASLLLNCLNEIEDFESKTVVLAQAIILFSASINSSVEPHLDGLIKQIDKKIEELSRQEDSPQGE